MILSKNLEKEFDDIWKYHDHELFNDNFALDLEHVFKSNFKKLEDAIQDALELMNKLTKKFKDKEYEITQKFTEKAKY